MLPSSGEKRTEGSANLKLQFLPENILYATQVLLHVDVDEVQMTLEKSSCTELCTVSYVTGQ